MMRPVDCRVCGTRVLVEKNSLPHTSVQWTTDAGATCGEFAPRVASGEYGALITHCGALRDAIDEAVRDGRIEVPPDDGPARSTE
ncbi:hypothetical protein [Microtetraspora niveoalba]|uniref:hypothetical protein n=1 Tax=Microtetraspora niveoalba TaxID=46175 RepID=UPI000ABBE965|nr:hypothetical protein [Microtetraspora niveoalba]